MKKIVLAYLLFASILFIVVSKQNIILAQQNIQLTLPQAENIFLQNNLKLIAEKYNISIAEANVIQAKLFENPNLNVEQNIYYAEDDKYFDFNKTNTIQIEQLFTLAGKRNKRINIEKINLDIAQLQFQTILIELKSTLRELFINAFYLNKSIAVYDKGINYLTKLIDVYDKQYEKGNVSLIEKARLKALLLTLQTEQYEIKTELIDINKELNMLLNQNAETTIIPTLDANPLRTFAFDNNTYNTLLNEINNIPQMLIAKKEIEAAEANIKLQKAIRIPDLTIGLGYEREGYLRPENVTLSFTIDLPIFNRNQGEIKIAEALYYQNQTLYKQTEKEITNELYAAYNKAQQSLNIYNSVDKELESDFDKLIVGIANSFEKKAISMLEFIDYYETYKETSILLNKIEKDTIIAIEDINKIIGKEHFNIVR